MIEEFEINQEQVVSFTAGWCYQIVCAARCYIQSLAPKDHFDRLLDPDFDLYQELNTYSRWKQGNKLTFFHLCFLCIQ